MKIDRVDYNRGYDKGYNDGCYDVMDKINKQGKWICGTGLEYRVMCSYCENIEILNSKNFCPNCGTPMTEEALEILRKRSGVSE